MTAESCGHCHSGATSSHCYGKDCGWIRCDLCHWITRIRDRATMPGQLKKTA